MNTLYWLIKRELWEHRGGFLRAPIITGGIFLLLNLMGIISAETLGAGHGFNLAGSGGGLNTMIRSMNAHDMSNVSAGLDVIMLSPSLLISTVMGFVVFFYCLGALYDERRDRSVLFWKSLPVSDTSTVLSKVLAATVLAPVIAVICGVITGLGMLLLFAITLSFHGVSVWSLLMLAHPFKIVGTLIGSIPLYVAWALPSVGWLMLCSAWARSKPFLWAAVLPIALGVMLGWFHLLGSLSLGGSWYWREIVGRILLSVFPGGWLTQNHDPFHSMNHVGPDQLSNVFGLAHSYQVLAAPNVWIGALLGIAMLAVAAWFRRWRDDT